MKIEFKQKKYLSDFSKIEYNFKNPHQKTPLKMRLSSQNKRLGLGGLEKGL